MLISIRENDPEFALKFGTQFHRPSYRQARLHLKRPHPVDLERPLSQSRQPKALLEKQREIPEQQQVLENESSDITSNESSKGASQALLEDPLESPSGGLSNKLPELPSRATNKDSTPDLSLESNTAPKPSQEEASDEWTTESGEISDHDSVHTLEVQEDSHLVSSTHDAVTARSQEAAARQEGRDGQAGQEENVAEDPGFDSYPSVS
jgi:hypothetical protein